jgi:aminoglycoside 3-N-acetyltransferase
MKITQSQIDGVLQRVLAKGDDVMIHAALKPIGFLESGVESLVSGICDAVGDTGTVVMMTDTRSFSQTGRFSIDQPSETGLLTEVFRKKKGVLRSCVPMVSFAAFGARAEAYTQPYNSYLDETSPIAELLRNDGKIMLLGIGYQKCTIYHLAEERLNVPYNFYKTFKGNLVEDGKVVGPVSQTYFVRRDRSVGKTPEPAAKLIEESKPIMKAILGGAEIKIFKAGDFDDCCMQVLQKDPEAFLLKSE